MTTVENLGDLDPVDAAAVSAAAICDGQAPTKGRIVMYRPSPSEAFDGNSFDADGLVAAVIVRHWGGGTCNLRLLTDGPTLPWVTSRTFGDGPAQWSWPRRVNP